MTLARDGLVGLLALAVGCGPKISSFTVTPARACATDTVVIRYATHGTGELRVMPRRVGTATDTTRYLLVVTKNGKSIPRAQDVLVYKKSDTDTLVLGPTRRHGADSIRVQDTLRIDFWPTFIVIGEVTSASGRPVAITHNGKSAVAAVNQPAVELAGSPVTGDWDVRAALLPGEQFATPGHSPPDRLRLRVVLRCDHAGATP
jgi:hypothetical protein